MKKRLAVIIGLVVAGAAVAAFETIDRAMPAASVTPGVLVTAVMLRQSTVPATVAAYGSIIAGPAAQTDIILPASGVIGALYVTPGQAVAAGDALALITPDPQSIADLRRALDASRAAQAAETHIAVLLQSHLATSADLAVATQAGNDASATLAAVQAGGGGTARTIRAAGAGIVAAILLDAGSQPAAGTVIMRIAAQNALVASVGLPAAQAISVSKNDSAIITKLSSGGTLNAKVAQIAAMLDPQTGLADATLMLSGVSLLGEPVEAVITTGTMTGYAVPRDAVQTDEAGDYVFQLDGKQIAHRIKVHVLGDAGAEVILAPGLDTSWPLVTDGAHQLDDGAAVRAAGSAGPGD